MALPTSRLRWLLLSEARFISISLFVSAQNTSFVFNVSRPILSILGIKNRLVAVTLLHSSPRSLLGRANYYKKGVHLAIRSLDLDLYRFPYTFLLAAYA